MERLNILQEKIGGLLGVVSNLKAENDTLINENNKLIEELANCQRELEVVRKSTEEYSIERESLIERLERLISMID